MLNVQLTMAELILIRQGLLELAHKYSCVDDAFTLIHKLDDTSKKQLEIGKHSSDQDQKETTGTGGNND